MEIIIIMGKGILLALIQGVVHMDMGHRHNMVGSLVLVQIFV
jgi:hypothetical protein